MFLRDAAALPLSVATVRSSVTASQTPNNTAQATSQTNDAGRPAGLIIRQKQPENLEFPFASLDSLITPDHRFYVRSHFPVPQLERRAHRLRIEGAIARPVELSFDDLVKLPSRTLTATLECAGNNRIFLVPAARGVQWELGAVGTAEWTGVPLAAVLEQAGVRPDAVEVVLEGADRGEVSAEPKPAGAINYARSLPLVKALDPDVLLAYRMNNAELTPAHGFPLRVVVPGWYGMASVKWLTRIIVTDRPFSGYYQTTDYTYWERENNQPVQRPLTVMQLKAEIARPAVSEDVAANTVYRMHGAAWSGDSEVARVEVSADGGKTWTAARLIDNAIRYTWRRWEYAWHTPAKPGRHTLMARATDSRGNAQPAKHDPDRGNYMINFVLPVDVEVR
ncbi:MAG: sulfite oxidase [Pyrinomonadaceae bacterium]|nr:sulfite oxidase [Pyrinomonadaceae bacterium]